MMAKGFRGPITWRLFRGLHISNPSLLNMFGSIMGGVLKFLKPQRFREIKQAWDEHSSSYTNREFNQYIACYMIYGVLPEEYICYRFETLNDKGRRGYVSDFSRYLIYDICNSEDKRHYFDNKYETYEIFKKYYHRDAILFDSDTSESKFSDFALRHREFICKPLKLYLGIDIEIFNVSNYSSVNALYTEIQKRKECILEELIIQSDVMSIFHSESVNTIRVPAFKTKEGVEILYPFLKVGRGNSIVDNGGQGGILAAIDTETGIVYSKGIDEYGNEYLCHPDSNVVFPGFRLPDWTQVIQLTKELMEIMKDIDYVGWDFAHTPNGWVVVEGNHEGQFVGQQMPRHKGCAEEVKRILERL